MLGITMGRALHRSFSLAALAVVLGAASCDRPDDDEVPPIVADRTLHAVLANTNLAFTAEIFSFPPELAFEDFATAGPRAVEMLRDRILALELQCAPQIEIGEDSIVTTFRNDCRVGVLRLEGEVHASVALESGDGPCPSGVCPTAVLWTIHDFDIQLGPDSDRPRLSGPVTLRDTVDAAAPMSWRTEEGFSLENRFGIFAADSFAEWNVRPDGCIDFTIESKLENMEGDAIDDEIGTIVAQAHDVHRCPARCPDAGRVRLAFGNGRLLEWMYGGKPGNGDDHVDVIEPRGHRFAQRLACL